MAVDNHSGHRSSLVVRSDEPLIGLVLIEDGQEVTRYFADEAEADAAVAAQATAVDARDLAGVWSDLGWDETVEELDRIRHERARRRPRLTSCEALPPRYHALDRVSARSTRGDRPGQPVVSHP